MTELEKRLHTVECQIWQIEMADYIFGSEREWYEKLKKERDELRRQLKK